MWVFGYGSLIWESWEKELNCDSKILADLYGFRRTFNKLSNRNFGIWERPCPTLNLLKEESAVCRGVAFHFPNHQEETVLAALRQREGKNFDLVQLPICLTDNRNVCAYTPLYTGTNLITNVSLDRLAVMIRDTEGRRGRCIDYITHLANAFAAHGIKDPCVDVLIREINQ